MTWTKAIWGSSFQRRCIQVVITIPQINIDRAISQVFYEFPLKLGYFMLCSMSIWWMDVDGNWSSMFITGYRVHDGLAVCAKILRHKCPERCWNKGSPMHHQFSSGKSWDMLMGQRRSSWSFLIIRRMGLEIGMEWILDTQKAKLDQVRSPPMKTMGTLW